MLKTFQRLGYSVPLKNLPSAIIQHIVSSSQLDITSEELEQYDMSGTRRRHIAIVREYLGLKAWGPPAKQEMTKAMETAAISKHDLADIINIAIEELIRRW